jgi:hypothetical protein
MLMALIKYIHLNQIVKIILKGNTYHEIKLLTWDTDLIIQFL